MFTNVSAVETVSSSKVPGFADAAFAFAIFVSTLTVDSRPWWQTMHRASLPRPETVSPDGNVTEDSVAVASLWHASHATTWPMGAGESTTPAGVPSAPT